MTTYETKKRDAALVAYNLALAAHHAARMAAYHHPENRAVVEAAREARGALAGAAAEFNRWRMVVGRHLEPKLGG